MNEILNEINEFKKQQSFINDQNKNELEQLNKGIKKQIDEFENIKRSLQDDNDDDKILIENKIDSLENEVNKWLEISKRLKELIERYMEENKNKLEEINKQVDIFKLNITEKLKETKKYIDSILANYSRN